jgi:hypothetical protein
MEFGMVSSSQIRAYLAMLLDDSIDLQTFEDWFVRNTWNIHLSGSVAAESVTFAIEESLSEYSSRHIDEQRLRQELSQILHAENKVVEVDAPRPVYSFKFAPLVLVPVRV